MGKSKAKSKSPERSSKEIVEFYNGTNVFTLPNGDTYFGEYCAHISGLIWREGHGVYKTADDQIYEGEWKNDKLIEGQDIVITYKDNTTYQVPILKHKCFGPGLITFDSGIKISANFEQNQLIGDAMMIDINGKLWHGITSENKMYFSPENVFFANIPRHRGKKTALLKELEPMWQPTPPIISRQSSQVTLPKNTRDMEKEIFARNFKVDPNIDFKNSGWYQNYSNYKQQKAVVLGKVKTAQQLLPEEKEWHNNYLQARKQLQKRKEQNFTSQLTTDSSTFPLLEKLFESTREENLKFYNVIYPTEDRNNSVEDQHVDKIFLVDSNLSVEKESTDDEEMTICEDLVESNTEEEDNLDEILLKTESKNELEKKSKRSVVADTESLFDFVSAVLEKRIKRVCKEGFK